MNRAQNPGKIVEFASRLAQDYRGAKHFEELRYPGLAARAQKLISQDPAKYVRIATALLDGETPTKIASTQSTDSNLVRFIRSMHPELVAAARTQMITNLEEVVSAMTARLLDETQALPIDKIPQALSTVLDKLSVLTGGVTARVEHTTVPKPEDLERMFKALPQVNDAN
jgi:hypothetical protein